jgi:hypothetical protein
VALLRLLRDSLTLDVNPNSRPEHGRMPGSGDQIGGGIVPNVRLGKAGQVVVRQPLFRGKMSTIPKRPDRCLVCLFLLTLSADRGQGSSSPSRNLARDGNDSRPLASRPQLCRTCLATASPSPRPAGHFMIVNSFGHYLSRTAHDHETTPGPRRERPTGCLAWGSMYRLRSCRVTGGRRSAP